MKVLSTKAEKLAKEIIQEVSKNGSGSEKIVDMLLELRQYFIESEDPTVTKVLRLTAEHIKEYGSFELNVQSDVEAVEGEEDSKEEKLVEYTPEENLNYLIGLCLDANNKYNREELFEIRDALIAY
jgi:hypothetical protein